MGRPSASVASENELVIIIIIISYVLGGGRVSKWKIAFFRNGIWEGEGGEQKYEKCQKLDWMIIPT